MNSNRQIFFFCPVPEEQKPINLYIQFKEIEKGFSLPIFRKKESFSILFLVVGFFFLGSFLMFNFFAFLFFVSFWKQIQNKLQTSRFFYEEASWYDGQTWQKPLSIIKNDHFLSSQELNPILQQIRRTLFPLFLRVFFPFYLFSVFLFSS